MLRSLSCRCLVFVDARCIVGGSLKFRKRRQTENSRGRAVVDWKEVGSRLTEESCENVEQAGRYAAGSGGRDGRGSVDVTGQNGGDVTSPGTPSP